MIKPQSPDDVIHLIVAHADNTHVFPATEDTPARVLFNPEDTSDLFVVTITGPYRTDHPADWADLAVDLGLSIGQAADVALVAERQAPAEPRPASAVFPLGEPFRGQLRRALGQGPATTTEVQPSRAEATVAFHNPVYALCVPCHSRTRETPGTAEGGTGGSSG